MPMIGKHAAIIDSYDAQSEWMKTNGNAANLNLWIISAFHTAFFLEINIKLAIIYRLSECICRNRFLTNYSFTHSLNTYLLKKIRSGKIGLRRIISVLLILLSTFNFGGLLIEYWICFALQCMVGCGLEWYQCICTNEQGWAKPSS